MEHVTVLERSTGLQAGAGIGLDDASAAILKGLGVLGPAAVISQPPALEKMRWTEERSVAGRVILRQPFPYFAVRYAELQQGLAQALPPDSIAYGRKVLAVQPLGAGRLRVVLAAAADEGGAQAGPSETLDCDLVVGADGPRSLLRRYVAPDAPADLSYALVSVGPFCHPGMGSSLLTRMRIPQICRLCCLERDGATRVSPCRRAGGASS